MTFTTILLMGAMLIAAGMVVQNGGATSTFAFATSRGSSVADVYIIDDYNNVGSILYPGKVYFDASGSEVASSHTAGISETVPMSTRQIGYVNMHTHPTTGTVRPNRVTTMNHSMHYSRSWIISSLSTQHTSM